jgi:hypothetical protein
MVAIADPDLQHVVENFEDMVDALERYRAALLARHEHYQKEGRDPRSYARPVASNIKRIERLQQLLDGEVYDLLRQVLDGSGVLANVDEGRWI